MADWIYRVSFLAEGSTGCPAIGQGGWVLHNILSSEYTNTKTAISSQSLSEQYVTSTNLKPLSMPFM